MVAATMRRRGDDPKPHRGIAAAPPLHLSFAGWLLRWRLLSSKICQLALSRAAIVVAPTPYKIAGMLVGVLGRGRKSFCWGWQRPSSSRTRLVDGDQNCIIVCGIYVIWREMYPGKRRNHDSGFTVARGSVAPVPLWSQNWARDVLMTSVRCQGGQFPMRMKPTESAIGGSICTRRGDFLGPRSPIFEKKHVELTLLYFQARFFYECSPYP